MLILLMGHMQEGSICNVDKETILNAYPLTNIK